VWDAGINYQGQYGGLGVDAAITGEVGSEDYANTVARDDLEAYTAGLNLSYAGFKVGGSYGKVDEWGQAKTQNSEASYWTLGAAYEYGPFGTSVTYLDSTVDNGTVVGKDNEFTNLSLGADYQLAPGLVPYVEISFFDTDDNDAATKDNDGSVFLVGTELSF
jgi:predicted porin